MGENLWASETRQDVLISPGAGGGGKVKRGQRLSVFGMFTAIRCHEEPNR